jgi:hypothetical protein
MVQKKKRPQKKTKAHREPQNKQGDSTEGQKTTKKNETWKPRKRTGYHMTRMATAQRRTGTRRYLPKILKIISHKLSQKKMALE